MGALVSNNAWGTLAIPITATATTIVVSGGQGARFPTAVEGKSWFYVTLINAENDLEVVKVIERRSDTFTVERGSDNTVAMDFAIGSRVELRPCAALFDDKVAKDELESEVTKLTNAYKAADVSVQKNLETSIEKVKADYATKVYVDELHKESTDTFDDYLKLEGGTLTGDLTIDSVGGKFNGKGIDLKLFKASDGTNQRGGSLVAEGEVFGQSFQSTSDVRLKEGIVYLEKGWGLQVARRIRGCRFNFIGSEEDVRIGVLAQAVQPVLPEVVRTRDDGYLTVDYQALAVVALQAVADLSREVDKLKKNMKKD